MREEQLEVPGFFWPLAAYAAVTLVSTTASVDPGVSLVDSKQLVLFLIVPVVYRLARGHRAHLFASVIIAVGAASALVGLFQYGFLHFDNLGRRPQGALTHYMTYSGALMLVACVAAARLLFGSRDRVWPLLVLPAVLVALGAHLHAERVGRRVHRPGRAARPARPPPAWPPSRWRWPWPSCWRRPPSPTASTRSSTSRTRPTATAWRC